MSATERRSEWPLTIPAARVSAAPLTVADEPGPAVRSALAERFDIPAIDALAAEVTLRRLTDGDIAATARLRARLTQSCVVTLDPVAEVVDVTVEGRFSERALELPPGDVVIAVDPDDESDEPEPILDGMLDLGEWLAQQLSLAMDPYPRAPGAGVDPAYGSEPDQEPPAHRPFAGLARLKRDGGDT